MNLFSALLFRQQVARPAARAWTSVGLERVAGVLRSLGQGLARSRASRGTPRLQVVEKIHLGEKQFIALLELDGQSFLASGSPGAPLQIAPSPLPQDRQARVKEAHAPEIEPVPAEACSAPEPVMAPTPAEQEVLPLETALSARPVQLKRRKGRPRRTITSPEKPAVPRLFAEDSSLAVLCGAVSPPAENAPSLPNGPAETASAESSVEGAEPEAETGPTGQVQLSLAQAVTQARAEKPARKPRRTTTPKQRIAAVPQPAEVAKFSAQPEAAALVETRLAPHQPVPEPQAELTSISHAVAKTDAIATTEEAYPKLDPTFAALLHIRMLAAEAFQEADAKPVLPPPPTPSKPSGLLRRFSISACLVLLLSTASAHAAGLAPAGGDIHITGLGGSSAPWSIVVVLTLLTLLPSLLFCITPFARLLIVFHFLRQALGLQTTPSNQTLIGLSLILTFFLMQPTGEVIYRDAILPVQAGKLTPLDGLVRAGDPMRRFMAHYVREKDAQLFLEIAHEPRPRTVEDMSFRVLLPAYILSELKAGFQIGTVLFLPFLIVDMVIASITTSVGMVQLPPVVISTPLKLLLFLMVDGWHLLIGSLMRSFN